MFKESIALLFACLLLAVPVAAQHSDPTRPPDVIGKKNVKPRYQLQSVLISAQRKVAVINDATYVEGDSIDTYRLARIEKNYVRLVGNGRSKVLELDKPVKVRR